MPHPITISLPLSLNRLLARIHDAGFSAHAVGGGVRDSLMGREVNDWDVTTSAVPEQIKAIFSDCRIIETGIQHGTVTVCFEGDFYEVTVYRVDGEYKDSRHPEQVTFATRLEDDLSRRDFTVNAMAYNPWDGLVDLYEGMADIKRGVIRAVGDPQKRFAEDALRILRAIRFASTLGFFVDEQTALAARTLAHTLPMISTERKCVELSKALCGIHAYSIFSEYYEIVRHAWPCFDTEDTYQNAVKCLPYLPQDLTLRLAVLFESAHLSDGQTLARTLLDLRFSKDIAKNVETLVLLSREPMPDATYHKRKMLGELGLSTCVAYAKLWESRLARDGQDTAPALALREAFVSDDSAQVCCTVSQLAISGKDLIALGIVGIATGKALAWLLDEVLAERTSNTKETLIAHLTAYFCH